MHNHEPDPKTYAISLRAVGRGVKPDADYLAAHRAFYDDPVLREKVAQHVSRAYNSDPEAIREIVEGHVRLNELVRKSK